MSSPWLRRARWLVLGAVGIAALGFGGTWFAVASPSLPRAEYALLGADFTLQSADGPVSTAALRGKAVIVYFGYTFCPDVCPTTLSDVAAALRALPPELAARTRVLFVSVDPARDTPERLRAYAAYFHPNIVGVTGATPELALIASRFGVSFAKRPLPDGEGYAMDHSGSLFVLDASGALATIVHHGAQVAEIERAVRAALAGAGSS